MAGGPGDALVVQGPQQLVDAGEARPGLLGVVRRPPGHPRPGRVDDVVAPALPGLALVGVVLEPLEHGFHGHLTSSPQLVDGAVHGAQQLADPKVFLLQVGAVTLQHLQGAGAATSPDDPTDLAQADAEAAQQHDLLQPQEDQRP